MKTFTYILFSVIFLLTSSVGQAYTGGKTQSTARTSVASATQTDSPVSIYPNPNKGIAKIKVNLPVDSNSKIRFSNTIGKTVKVIDLSAVTTGNEVSIDLTTLPAGIYFYSVFVNDKLVETKRLILEL